MVDMGYYLNILVNLAIGLIICIVIIVLGFILASIVSSMFKKYLRKWAEKTETKIDDIIIEAIESPIKIIIIVYAIYFGLSFLPLPYIITLAIGNFVKFVVILAITWFVAKIGEGSLEHYILPYIKKEIYEGLDENQSKLFKNLTTITICIIGLLIALDSVGFDISILLLLIAIFGLGFALALKDIFSHFLSGVLLFWNKIMKVNNNIKVGSVIGRVKEMHLTYTKLETPEGEEVIIPNAKLINEIIIKKKE
ncbi:mechanosensitive ion channel MscS [Methanocaldococcus villosus KIN24-T80]|uniref:Mechanosensitive ion channel MscS n=1 Tax=Methanocaldococcus villosus KIN24-T80 TaxID=1069083 RepID=N6VT12_9EURY|nr:mechanosensitive ion channel domain-containing protein [Methanocaldococcus villosus]ENN96336.1 mechanosensitive ion channel MscS [Methanocaldococcus villosus KIN24-T80]